MQALTAALERYEAQAVGENFILNHGGVVLYIDVLNSEGRDLSDEDAAEGVGNGCVDADKGEGGEVRVVVMEVNIEAVAKAVDGKSEVFAWEVAWEVG